MIHSPALEEALAEMIDALQADGTIARASDAARARELLDAALGLLGDGPASLDLKIASAALDEMRNAFAMFAPYRDVPKATVFGSARTAPSDPLYTQATTVARLLADRGWMLITGAGPGIMHAASEGAGRSQSFGVSIRLPFESAANPVIAGDHKSVAMRYFFTRKLMLVKESAAFVCLPGGFGTLDETFELLTLTQTGKGVPVPIVFLDTPADAGGDTGETYWQSIDALIRDVLAPRGLVSPIDSRLYLITDSPAAAVAEIERFYSTYDSIRYVGRTAVIRLKRELTPAQIAELNATIGPSVADSPIVASAALPVEVRSNDKVELPRLRFDFSGHRYGALRLLIDAINAIAA